MCDTHHYHIIGMSTCLHSHVLNKLINLGTIIDELVLHMMIQRGPYWWGSSSLEDRIISQVTSLWGLFEKDYIIKTYQNDTLNLHTY